jgi:membrane protease YdiL (CAAX protease family)
LYLYPRFATLVILGFLWGWWHVPYHLALGITGQGDLLQYFLSLPFVFVAFYLIYSLSEGSLWPLIFTHAAYNTVAT